MRSTGVAPAFKFLGVELYFDDLAAASTFYGQELGLPVADEDATRYIRFTPPGGFVCLERRGSEDYPSRDKAVLFLETPDLEAAADRIGQSRFVRLELDAQPPWGVLQDPEGHSVLLVQAQ